MGGELYIVPKVIVTTSFPVYYVENLFDVYFIFSLNCFIYFVVIIFGSEINGVSEVRVTILFSMSFDKTDQIHQT